MRSSKTNLAAKMMREKANARLRVALDKKKSPT
jgi:hypothetical protein